MKKLTSIKTRENFELMQKTSDYIINELQELNEEIYNDLQSLQQDGYYCTLSEEVFNSIPIEERYYQKYYITYAMSVLLVKYYLSGHKEVHDQMISTLYASLSMKYIGHGYDDHSIRLKYLIELYDHGITKIFKEHRGIEREFGLLVYEYRRRLYDNTVHVGFGSIKEDIMKLLSIVDKNILFVYGTLMEEQVNAHYLNKCPLLGEAFITGYSLVQLNGYPGMIKMNGEVVGELYSISPRVKKQLDILEGSQYQYSRGIVYTNNCAYYAHFYEFIMQDHVIYHPSHTINNKWIDISNYIWYASYGSNILQERFDKYINQTTSKLKPLDSRPIILPYQLYFAKNSLRWNHQGVAFLDDTSSSMTYGWMYLITKEQFKEIKVLEGKTWYGKEVLISQDELGIPIYTLTSLYKYDDVKASKEYLEVIGAGLKQKYHLPSSMIDEYLNVKDYDYTLENVLHTLSNK